MVLDGGIFIGFRLWIPRGDILLKHSKALPSASGDFLGATLEFSVILTDLMMMDSAMEPPSIWPVCPVL